MKMPRWVWVAAAIVVGGMGGFLCGYYLCAGMLTLVGRGNSHNDIFTLLTSAMVGAGVGGGLFPVLLWFFIRDRPK
jgi:hypothetical protein